MESSERIPDDMASAQQELEFNDDQNTLDPDTDFGESCATGSSAPLAADASDKNKHAIDNDVDIDLYADVESADFTTSKEHSTGDSTAKTTHAQLHSTSNTGERLGDGLYANGHFQSGSQSAIDTAHQQQNESHDHAAESHTHPCHEQDEQLNDDGVLVDDTGLYDDVMAAPTPNMSASEFTSDILGIGGSGALGSSSAAAGAGDVPGASLNQTSSSLSNLAMPSLLSSSSLSSTSLFDKPPSNVGLLAKGSSNDTLSQQQQHGSQSSSHGALSGTNGGYSKRVSCYVGNLTWWTTDKDLADAVSSLGVADLIEIKFYENKVNGQSKGFAHVNVGSDQSFRLLMDKLPKVKLNGQEPVVTHFTRHFFNQFEEQARKDMPSTAGNSGNMATSCGNGLMDHQYNHHHVGGISSGTGGVGCSGLLPSQSHMGGQQLLQPQHHSQSQLMNRNSRNSYMSNGSTMHHQTGLPLASRPTMMNQQQPGLNSNMLMSSRHGGGMGQISASPIVTSNPNGPGLVGNYPGQRHVSQHIGAGGSVGAGGLMPSVRSNSNNSNFNNNGGGGYNNQRNNMMGPSSAMLMNQHQQPQSSILGNRPLSTQSNSASSQLGNGMIPMRSSMMNGPASMQQQQQQTQQQHSSIVGVGAGMLNNSRIPMHMQQQSINNSGGVVSGGNISVGAGSSVPAVAVMGSNAASVAGILSQRGSDWSLDPTRNGAATVASQQLANMYAGGGNMGGQAMLNATNGIMANNQVMNQAPNQRAGAGAQLNGPLSMSSTAATTVPIMQQHQQFGYNQQHQQQQHQHQLQQQQQQLAMGTMQANGLPTGLAHTYQQQQQQQQQQPGMQQAGIQQAQGLSHYSQPTPYVQAGGVTGGLMAAQLSNQQAQVQAHQAAAHLQMSAQLPLHLQHQQQQQQLVQQQQQAAHVQDPYYRTVNPNDQHASAMQAAAAAQQSAIGMVAHPSIGGQHAHQLPNTHMQQQQQHQQVNVMNQMHQQQHHMHGGGSGGVAGSGLVHGGAAALKLSDFEFQEALEKNRIVSSSAISRAVQDASIGQYALAIETLVTAISLIKQSKIANDERCKLFISSLQDTKKGIEDKYYGSGGGNAAPVGIGGNMSMRSSSTHSGGHGGVSVMQPQQQQRTDSRDRDRSKRSRSRDSRDRDRDRERERDRDRDRERDRDRDRDRDSRSRRGSEKHHRSSHRDRSSRDRSRDRRNGNLSGGNGGGGGQLMPMDGGGSINNGLSSKNHIGSNNSNEFYDEPPPMQASSSSSSSRYHHRSSRH